jgi:hypothetical protein
MKNVLVEISQMDVEKEIESLIKLETPFVIKYIDYFQKAMFTFIITELTDVSLMVF